MTNDNGTHSIQFADRLKTANQAAHDKLESLAYFQDMLNGTLSLGSYVAHLKAFAVILGVLERELANL